MRYRLITQEYRNSQKSSHGNTSVNGVIGGVLEEEAVGTEGWGRVGDRGGSTGPLDTGGVGT